MRIENRHELPCFITFGNIRNNSKREVHTLSTLSMQATRCFCDMRLAKNCPKVPKPTIPILKGFVSARSLGRVAKLISLGSTTIFCVSSAAAFTGPTRRDFLGYDPRMRIKSACSRRCDNCGEETAVKC